MAAGTHRRSRLLAASAAAMLVALAAPAAAQTATGKSISRYPSAATPLTGSEIFPLNQNGTTKQTSLSSMVPLFAPTSAQITTALGGTPLLLSGGGLTGPLTGPNLGATPSGGCDTSQWPAYSTGTLSPIPLCSAVKIAPTVSIPYPGVVGLGDASGNAVPANDPTYLQRAANLTQVVSALGNSNQENARGVNYIVSTGGGGAAITFHSQKVADSIFVLQRPGGTVAWGQNIDVRSQAGVGNYSLIGTEVDLDNGNGDAVPGGCSPCSSGQINASLYVVKAVATQNPVTSIFEAEGGPASGSFSAHFGINFSAAGGTTTLGQGLVKDATINDGSNSTDVIRVYGTHTNGLNTTLGTVPYPIRMALGQLACFNSADACWSYAGGNNTRFTQNGGLPLVLIGSASGVNGVGLTSAGTGFGPIIRPTTIGSDTNITLNLSGLGTNGVNVIGGLTVTGNASATSIVASGNITVAQNLILNLATPATSSAACTAGTVGVDAGYVYVCTSSSNYKRVALTTF